MTESGKLESQDNLDGNLGRRALRRLSFARLTVTLLLLAATWWWRSSFSNGNDAKIPFDLAILYTASIAFSLLNILATRTSIRFRVLARLQLFGDIGLITALVSMTGGAAAPSATLYIMTVAASGYFLRREETLLLSVFGAGAFVSVVLTANWGQLIRGDGLGADISQTLALTVAGTLIVGLLAGRVSDRRKIGEELRETVESLGSLKILHERIVESMQTGLIATDLDGMIYDANQAALSISGFSRDELIGLGVVDFLGEEPSLVLDKLNSSKSRVLDNREVSVECVTRGPKRTEVRCRISPLLGTNGSSSGFVITFEDLTEIRRMEESVRKSDRLAAIGRMAAGLAHEIRNPLGSMGSALQFLRERSKLDDEDRELLEVALKESNRLDEIIRNFLTYAKPGTNVFGKDGSDRVDLLNIFKDSAALLSHSPEIREHHSIALDLPNEAVIINGNEVQIKQIFWNIARNAITAMPTGGALTIKLEKSDDAKHAIAVFKDDGIGISEDRLQNLFEPFSEEASGTGLGLSIVRKIVTDHGGTVEIQSTEGIGTDVVIRFPIADQGD